MKKSLGISLSLAFLAIVFLVLNIVSIPTDTLLGEEIENLGHMPLFGVLSIAILTLSRAWLGRWIKRPLIHYALAFVVTSGIGALTEFIQYFEARDADFSDLVRDIIGAVTFLGIYLTFDKNTRQLWKSAQNRLKILIRVVSILVLAGMAMPLTLWIGAYIYRDNSFPVLFSADSYWSRRFLEIQDANLSIIPAPAEWTGLGRKSVAKLVLEPAKYPGITLREPFPDWQGYHTMIISLYSPADTTISLGLRVDDIHHNFDYRDRYTEKISVAPGADSLLIPLDRIRMAPQDRETDMAHISAIWLFAGSPRVPITIYIDNFQLE